MMSKLRIAQVCMSTMGGSSTVAVRLAEQLAQRGHESFVITDKPSYAQTKEVHSDDTLSRVKYISPPEMSHSVCGDEAILGLALSQAIGEIAIEHHLDLIHVHYLLPFGIWAENARKNLCANTALAITLHGTDVVDVPNGIRRISAQALCHAEIVTSVSDSVAKSAQETFGITKTITVPNWAPDPVIDETKLAAYKAMCEPGEIILTHVSNYRPVKQAEHCVRILEEVNKVRPARLLLVGDGPDLEFVLTQAKLMGLEGRVVSLGRMPDPINVIAISDFLLLPSRSEAAPLVALEAASVGVPTAGYPVGGIPEMITDGETGVIAEFNNTKQIAEGILAIVTDDEKFVHVRNNCLALSSIYSADLLVDKYEKLYEVAMQKRIETVFGSAALIDPTEIAGINFALPNPG